MLGDIVTLDPLGVTVKVVAVGEGDGLGLGDAVAVALGVGLGLGVAVAVGVSLTSGVGLSVAVDVELGVAVLIPTRPGDTPPFCGKKHPESRIENANSVIALAASTRHREGIFKVINGSFGRKMKK